MDTKRMTQAAVSLPASKVLDRFDRTIARRTPLSTDAIRSLVGAVFLAMAVRRLLRALRAGFAR